MEEWIKEQIQYNRTIYIYNNSRKYTKCAFNECKCSPTFLSFIKYIYSPNNDLIFSDLHGINKSWTNFTTRIFYRSTNAPINIPLVYDFLESMDKLIEMKDTQVFDKIIEFFKTCDTNTWSEHADEKSYYMIYLLSWFEKNLNSLMGIIDIQYEYKTLNRPNTYANIISNISLINQLIQNWYKLNNHLTLANCLQIKKFIKDWNKIFSLLF